MIQLSFILEKMQRELFPLLNEELGVLTDKEKKLVEILELLHPEDFVSSSRGVGRPCSDRKSLVRSFITKAFYNLPTTKLLMELLNGNPAVRRLCGFESKGDIPSESTFSRAFFYFAQLDICTHVHQNVLQEHLSEVLVGHICRDSTAIEAREKATPKKKKQKQSKKRGRPKKSDSSIKREKTVLEQQCQQPLHEILSVLPKSCDINCKRNGKGYTNSWKGYKLHMDVTEFGVPISCVVTAASVHDSQVAIPLSRLSSSRITYCYELMDSGYDSPLIALHSQNLNHVALIDHNPRRKRKRQFEPAEKKRYTIRTQVERSNARLKDEFGALNVRVKGHAKVTAHLMFGVLVLVADQLIRLIQ